MILKVFNSNRNDSMILYLLSCSCWTEEELPGSPLCTQRSFIGIFQISCLKVTWIYHLANSAVKPSFYLSQSRQQWKWRFITFSPGLQCCLSHPLADRLVALSSQLTRAVADTTSALIWLCRDEGGCGFETLNALLSPTALPCGGCCAVWALQFSPGWNDLIRWFQRAGWSRATCFLRRRVSSAFLELIKHMWKGCLHPMKTLL